MVFLCFLMFPAFKMGLLSTQFAYFWANLGQVRPLEANLKPTWTNLVQLGANFEPTWANLGQLGANLEPTWAYLEPTCANLSSTRPIWGSNLGVQGSPLGVRWATFWVLFGSWSCLGAKMAPRWPPGPILVDFLSIFDNF